MVLSGDTLESLVRFNYNVPAFTITFSLDQGFLNGRKGRREDSYPFGI